MYRSFISGIVASTLGVVSVVPVTGHPLCRPTLNVTGVQFSKMIPPTLERKWTAVVSLDAFSVRNGIRTLRDFFLAAKGNRPRSRIPGAVHMAAAFGDGFGRFLV